MVQKKKKKVQEKPMKQGAVETLIQKKIKKKKEEGRKDIVTFKILRKFLFIYSFIFF